MAHFAKVENEIVTQVIVAEQDVIDSGLFGDPNQWIQTSYNTRNNVHYGQDGKPDNGVALRGNFAGIGYTYNKKLDAFYPPQPYPSWVLSPKTINWESPVPYPDDGKRYEWNEDTKSWDVVTEDIGEK